MLKLNKLRQRSWYYAVSVTLAGLLVSAAIILLSVSYGLEDTVNEVDISALGLGAIGVMLVSIGGMFLFDKLSKSSTVKLRWVLSRPFMWQLVIFLLAAGLTVAILKVIQDSASEDYFIFNALSIGLNVTYSSFVLLVFYKFAKVVLYRKPVRN